MSVNLISIASQYLTPEVISRISSFLGVNPSIISKACSAALPALLGGFANAASAGDGAHRLSNAVNRQGTNILDDLSQVFGNSQQRELANDGLDSLSFLLGSSSVASLAGAIGKFAGLGQTSASSLLGMLTPMVLGILGKQFSGRSIDPVGISQLLASQKNHIAAAMPSGFKSLLQTPEFSNLSLSDQIQPSWSRSATGAQSLWTGPMRWVVPLIILGLVVWGISSLYNNRTNVTQQATSEGSQPTETMSVGGVDLKSATQKAIDGVKSALQAVNDENSARAALPKLQSAATDLDNVIQLSKQLPDAGKKTIGSIAAAAQPETTQLFNKVQNIPAADTVAKPTIDTLRAQIDTLSKAA